MRFDPRTALIYPYSFNAIELYSFFCLVSGFEVEAELTSVNWDSIKLNRTAAQLPQPVQPAKLSPSGLRFIKETKLGGFCYTVSHYKGLIYVGLGVLHGKIDRINQQGWIAKGFIKLKDSVRSLKAHGNRLYCLCTNSFFSVTSSTLSVHGLDDGRLLTC